ncbi:NAD-dependent succinate-semialdehyde dehydrogenase [Lacisediminihabitans profunda]|uniref:NAD-dependent succinate-semialdehyde dehydrogenase n=1 Tax=Lacisediminihabitans profunda TaxID=2594790 RepID=A0A5C8UPZ2_9MICO|nr:NAD-dependent succinate-semialdehyde dehydrogenase [Lacisediminihabitans profunda]TXN29954.1 NAD-dependent succinate-semialdehyde dehydrogenase [Lacisediminihabitans profunda]
MSAETEAAVLASVPKGLLRGGRWVDSSTGNTLGVEDPSTGEVLVQVADASVEDALAAMDAAVAAQPSWAATAPRVRGEILRRTYEIMTERNEDLALLMTLEMGKPIAESRSEVAYAADFFRWFAEEAVRLDGSWSTAPDGKSRIVTLKQPVGPCLLVTPWNFPLAMGARKIGPAVAAGCTVIVKPAKQTPLSMHAIAAILTEAGLPDGVLGTVTTSKASAVVSALIDDPRLRKLSFTGSTEVGQSLAGQAAKGPIRLSLELGGNAPFVVFEDADVDHAVDQAMLAKLRNNGEACTAANRFYVHESILDEFSSKFAARFETLVVGRGTQADVTLGPLIDQAAVDKVEGLVAAAVAEGAIVLYETPLPNATGYFSPARVITGVSATSRLVAEEIFGPVAPIVAFSSEEEVLGWANDSEYGLAAYLFTRDLDRAVRMSERLEAGMIGVNRGVLSNPAAPFGGIKSSGYGREGGHVGIDEYVETKYLSLNVG